MLPAAMTLDRRTTCLVDSRLPVLPQPVDTRALREQFPIFAAHPEVIYFDNASTTQKPRSVIEAMRRFYEVSCSNAGRAAYAWSTQLTSAIEEARSAVATFINAEPEDLAFTSGATDSLNLVAMCWALHNLRDGDEIMICLEDHQSAILPWLNVQAILKRLGMLVRLVPFQMHHSGTYDRRSMREGLSERTRIISLTHVHHVYGMEMDLPELRKMILEGVLISLDCSQSIGHTSVDVKNLGAHFISFSGHKMFAANGTGVLWTHPQIRDRLWPVRVGAKSAALTGIDQFDIDKSRLSGLVECGTLNLPGILSLGEAVKFVESVGLPSIEEHVSGLTRYLYERLVAVPGLEFAPGIGVCGCTRGYGIVSFRISGLSSGDLAAYLDSERIFVRTGDHCRASSDPMDYLRVSMHVYNSRDEVDRFLEVLLDAAG